MVEEKKDTDSKLETSVEFSQRSTIEQIWKGNSGQYPNESISYFDNEFREDEIDEYVFSIRDIEMQYSCKCI